MVAVVQKWAESAILSLLVFVHSHGGRQCLFGVAQEFSKFAIDNGRSTLSFVSCPQETDENAVLCPFFLNIHPYIANHSCKTPHSSAQ